MINLSDNRDYTNDYRPSKVESIVAELRVAHCTSCGKVFQINLRSLCSECADRLDRQFEAVDRYLMKNRQASTEEASEQTGVPVKQIQEWIRQKRLSLSAHPNLTDSCNLCGSPTRTGTLCIRCTTRLKSDIQKMHEEEAAMRERTRSAQSYKSKTDSE